MKASSPAPWSYPALWPHAGFHTHLLVLTWQTWNPFKERKLLDRKSHVQKFIENFWDHEKEKNSVLQVLSSECHNNNHLSSSHLFPSLWQECNAGLSNQTLIYGWCICQAIGLLIKTLPCSPNLNLGKALSIQVGCQIWVGFHMTMMLLVRQLVSSICPVISSTFHTHPPHHLCSSKSVVDFYFQATN